MGKCNKVLIKAVMMELTLTSPDGWHLHLRNGELLAAVAPYSTFFDAHAVKTSVSAVTSGSKRYFLGADSAPHERQSKECSCGYAGIFNAPVALSLYSKVFEEANALDKLEAFTSFDGPDFYGLPRNTSKLKLIKEPWKVPECIFFPFGEIIPMFAGQMLGWQTS